MRYGNLSRKQIGIIVMEDVKKALIKLALIGNKNQIREMLSDFDEIQRAEIYPVVNDLKKLLTQTNQHEKKVNSPEWKQDLSKRYEKLAGIKLTILIAKENKIQFAIKIIAVACGPEKILKYPFFIAEMNHRDGLSYAFFFKVLADRDPPWLIDWLPLWFKFYPPMGGGWGINWDDFWLLMKNGERERPYHPLYPLYLDGQFPVSMSYSEDDEYDNIPFEDTLTERLKRYPSLLDQDIWYLFHVDVKGFNEKDVFFSGGTLETWGQAFINLVNEGLINRKKLLEETLAALTRPLRNTTLRYFSLFYNKLQASPDELNKGQTILLGLLSSDKSHIVNYALKKVQILAVNNLLDWNNFFNACRDIFSHQVSSNIKLTIMLLKMAFDRDDTRAHEISLLLGHVESPTNISVEKIYRAFREKLNLPSPQKTYSVDAYLSDPAQLNETTTITKHPHKNGPTSYPGAGHSWKCAPLIEAERIPHIECKTELDKQFENEWQLLAIDGFHTSRVLDAISRLCLTHNIQKLGIGKTLQDEYLNMSMDGYHLLLLAWHYGFSQIASRVGNQYFSNDQSRKNDLFYYEIYNRLQRRQSAPLLSLPSHKWGWICGSVFATRLNYYAQNDIEVPVEDFTKAIYRLHCGERLKALNILADNNTPAAKFLRYALAGDPVSGLLASKYPQWWLGASRVRQPRGDLSLPSGAHIEAAGPHGLWHYHYEWEPVFEATNQFGPDPVKIAFHFPNTASVKESDLWIPTAYPNYALTSEKDFSKLYGFYSNYVTANSYADSRPIILDSYLHSAIRYFVYCYDEIYDYAAEAVALLNPLDDPRQEISELAYILITFSLAGAHKKVRDAGTRLVANTINEDRFDAILLGKTIGRFYEAKGLKSGRIAKSFIEISALCPDYRYEIVQTLSSLFEHFPKGKKPDHHLLASAIDICQTNNQSLTSASFEALSKSKLSGKSTLLLAKLFELNKTLQPSQNIYDKRLKQRKNHNLNSSPKN
jgi:hypothetical protein